MQLTQQEHYFQNTPTDGKNYGRIYPLKWGYYANPQMCMFSFTLILTTSISAGLVVKVFAGFYHQLIGTLLCLYVIYRFASLGLSNPGLAVESFEEEKMQFDLKLEDGQHRQNSLSLEEGSHNIVSGQDQGANSHRSLGEEISGMDRQMRTIQGTQGLRTFPNGQQYGQSFYGFCRACRIPIKRNTRHCSICKTCVEGHDHHCIWIGKCIGKKNMWQFKEFLCMVFSTLIYGLILTLKMTKIQKIHKD